MNKNLALIGATLALSLTLVGCNKSGKLGESSTFKTPSGPVELKLKWPQGERIVQDMDMKQTSEISIPGQPAPTKQDTTMGMEYGLTVLLATPDGGREVEMEFLSARMKTTVAGRTRLDYDSTRKSTTGKPNPLDGIYGKIVGSKIRFFLDATNGVERIEGVDEMMNRLQAGATPADLAPLKSIYTEGYFKQLMQANQYMPPKAVQPGDTWPVQIEVPVGMMGNLVLNYDFTLKSWEMHGKRNCARLEFSGTIKSTPDTNASPTGMSFNILGGDFSGISWFDPEIGMTIDTTMNQDINMVIRLPMNPGGNRGGAGQMQNLTNQMTQVQNIKLSSVK
jgi:hypothetical protein